MDFEPLIELSKKKRKMQDSTHSFKGSNSSCGDEVTIFLRVKNDRIEDASFDGRGCIISMASAALLTEHIKGKTLEEVKKLTKEAHLELLGFDLSRNPSRLKCALLSFIILKENL
ncbi:iron-sulfur cluster assembly scaffold protein [Candidatus Micrarchaeota archaeon]|nr:iron-sulfur cluster assembly scaffold protein [Candidatus Micrarchaeota archaeon]